MKNFILGLIALISASGMAGNCWSSETMICPSTVRVASGLIEPKDVPAGYRPIISNSSERLSGGSVFDGPPEEGGSLKPFSSSAKSHRAKWVFAKEAKYEVWISCDYANGLIRLVKRVHEPVASCTAIFDKTNESRVLEGKFICN